MDQQPRWRDLRIGIAAVVVISILTVVILVYGRLGRIPGETYHAYVRTEDARGIIKGSAVWLNGQKVGAVRDIDFLPPSAAAGRRLLLRVELMKRHQDAIRHDSEVHIRSGGSLIGAPVVYMMVGSAAAPVVAEGDTIEATDQFDLDTITAQLAGAARELPVLLGDAKTVFGLLQSPEGTVGALMTDAGASEAGAVRARMGQIASSLGDARGTAGLALRGEGALVGRAKLAMARADSVRQLIASPHTSLGRFRRDSTLAANVADVRNELSIVRALIAEARGTLGRLALDSAIVLELAEVEREMAALLADVKKRPFRYFPF